MTAMSRDGRPRPLDASVSRLRTPLKSPLFHPMRPASPSTGTTIAPRRVFMSHPEDSVFVRSSLASLLRVVLAGASLGVVSLSIGCACPERWIVAEVPASQVPTGANAGPSSRPLSPAECATLCGGAARECRIVDLCAGGSPASCANLVFRAPLSDGGTGDGGPRLGSGVQCLVTIPCIGGRRVGGCVIASPEGVTSEIAAYIARQSALESISVPAFERLAQDLAVLGAPEMLIARAHASADEERTHARLAAELATELAASPLAFTVPASRPCTAVELAVENAVEGCVRETFAALLAARQAARATDPRAREFYQRIAPDELSHSELSCALHHWLAERLSPPERAAVRSAMNAAADALRAEWSSGNLSPAARAALGLPSTDEALSLLDTMRASLLAELDAALGEA
jgi:hypothetical protein